jgi:hypothetical protein
MNIYNFVIFVPDFRFQEVPGVHPAERLGLLQLSQRNGQARGKQMKYT